MLCGVWYNEGMAKVKNPDEKAAKEMAGAAVELGARLAMLVSLLNISDEEKEAFTYLLEECTLEELEKIEDVLKARFLQEATKKEDEKFAKEMEKLLEKWEKKEAKIAERTTRSLRKLEEELNKKIGVQTNADNGKDVL